MAFSAKKYQEIIGRKNLSIARNTLVKKGLKEDLRINLQSLVSKEGRRATLDRFNNRCIVSNRGKSVYRAWRVSRIILRHGDLTAWYLVLKNLLGNENASKCVSDY